MAGLVEAASISMQRAQQKLEVAAINIANSTTPGYKAISDTREYTQSTSRLCAKIDQGKLQATGRPLDLAISGDGFFQVRSGNETLYTRQGQFSLSSDGLVISPQGYVLQQDGGGDLSLERGSVAISGDGMILDDGRSVGRIALFHGPDGAAPTCVDGTLFMIDQAQKVEAPQVRQGMLEASTVDVGGQMASSMLALREADAGAKLFQTYDDLLGRAITTFEEAGR